ncbi:MAG TPA: DUF2059 domain-containing protein [Polaromonas sp.]|uniref:DUF2059 domain-containing protein n=1 Tax=Polaromonas sp. UBA4122 TaxID=1947074 RepID=UPI000EC752AE|nr:DUF2059 domain-containing protein [Polaromonas sp. UBA4122]HAL38209.1 DUF2059 domain-containing protein [Polaromonas sp.]
MKKLIATLAITGLASLACTTALHAQTSDPKTEWAKKVVALQQGPELDRLVAQLAGSTTQELIATWGPKLEANVPKAKQQKASEDLNVELKKYAEDAKQLIGKQVSKVSADVLVPAYAERFTVEELKQIAAFFESPAIKKYQATTPQLGTIFIQKLVEASRSDVVARAKRFDDAALKIVGTAPAGPGAGKPARK